MQVERYKNSEKERIIKIYIIVNSLHLYAIDYLYRVIFFYSYHFRETEVI